VRLGPVHTLHELSDSAIGYLRISEGSVTCCLVASHNSWPCHLLQHIPTRCRHAEQQYAATPKIYQLRPSRTATLSGRSEVRHAKCTILVVLPATIVPVRGLRLTGFAQPHCRLFITSTPLLRCISALQHHVADHETLTDRREFSDEFRSWRREAA
jgi:hypothetical protein